jgi:hypothetical protein
VPVSWPSSLAFLIPQDSCRNLRCQLGLKRGLQATTELLTLPSIYLVHLQFSVNIFNYRWNLPPYTLFKILGPEAFPISICFKIVERLHTHNEVS